MRVILASGSPRRRELLSQIGIEYEVFVSNADEDVNESDPAKLVSALSRRKAEAVACETDFTDDVIIIGADTVVSVDGKILGKPKTGEIAHEMLQSLQGRKHEVYTGVTLLKIERTMQNGSRKKEVKTFYECTGVNFYPMSSEEIDEYIATGDPMDKAGSYGIQGFCARYISSIEGDYNNVVGLPIGRLYQEIKSML